MQEVYEEFKQHYDKLTKECNEISKRHMETLAEKKQIEAENESQLKHLRSMLEQREKTLDEQRSKALMPTDTDMLRAKIAREIEAPLKLKNETLIQEIEKLEAEISELRRSNALQKSELEAASTDHDRQLFDIKQKHQGQIADLMAELQTLHSKVEDSKDKEQVRVLKENLMNIKGKYLESQRESAELRKQRDELKLEKNTILIDVQGKLTENNRNATAEVENLTDKLRKVEEELSKELKISMEKNEQIQALTSENDSIKLKMQELEIEYQRFETQKNEFEGKAKEQEEAVEIYIKKIQDDQQERNIYEREEKSKLQKEIERLQALVLTAEESRKKTTSNISVRYEESERERRILLEEQKMLRKKINDMQSSYEILKLNYIKVADGRGNLEEEVRKLQAKCRELIQKDQELMTAKQHLEFSMKTVEEEFHKIAEEKKFWNGERTDLQKQIAEMTQKLELSTRNMAEHVKKYKQKAVDYKNKVKQANLKLQQMASKLSRFQIEGIQPGYDYKAVSADIGKTPFVPAEENILIDAAQDAKQLEEQIAETLEKNKEMQTDLGI